MNTRMARTILNRQAIGLAAILACSLGHSLPSALAAPGSWTRKADMPIARGGHAACEVDGILYVMGGGTKTNSDFPQLQSLLAYDPKTDSWTPKRDMPTARRFLAACAVDGIIYTIGGGGLITPPTDAVEAYDPKTDTWMAKAHLPAARSAVTACAVDGIIYAIGGADNMQDLTRVEAYDPKTDQWTPKTKLPAPAIWAAACAVNGLIYAFFDKDTFEYHPKTDRWTRKASIPSGSLRCILAGFSAVDGMVFLFGGEISSTAGGYDLSLAYDPTDPVQDKFSAKRKMPMKCMGAAAATIDGKIFLTGGGSGDPLNYPGAAYYKSLWVFDPQGGVTPKLLTLNRESPDRVRLAWQGEAGRLYGVESTLNAVKGPWTRINFSTGTNSILATNELVEATCTVLPADTKRFFRVLEAN